MPRLLFALLLLVLLMPAEGRAQKYFYSQYRPSQGLPSSEVQAVTRDSLGFLWIATDNGLARYNGQSFTHYQAGLGSRYVKSLFRRPDGSILLANDAGVFALTPQPDTAQIERLVGAHPRPTDSTVVYPNGVHQDSRGHVWVSQPNGTVARLKGGELHSFSFGEDHATGQSDSGFFFANDRRGGLWMVASTGQLYRFDAQSSAFRRLSTVPSVQRVHDLRVRNDTLWVAGKGLLRAGITEDTTLTDVRRFSTDGRQLTHLAFGSEGMLLGTQEEGLFRGEVEGAQFSMRKVFGSTDPHRIEQLPFLTINDVYLDREGSIWLASREGLGLLQSRFFSGVPGMTKNNTLSVYSGEDRVLLSFGDVYEVRPGLNREFIVRQIRRSDQNFVTSIASVDGTLWMGTANGRLQAVRAGQARRAIDLTDRGGGIFYMLGDRRGDLWFCQAPDDAPLKGVTRIDEDGTLTFYDADDGVENRILVLTESPRGTLYAAGIGPQTYLFRYQPDRDRFINLSLPLPFSYSQNFEVHDLAVDDRGIVWLATTDGLLRYDLERVQRVDLGPFTTTEIRSVEAMGDGSIWLGTDTHGLLHYRNGTWVQFAEDAGLPTDVIIYRTLRRDEHGRIWVGTAEGAVHSRDRIPVPESTSTPLLLSASVNGRPSSSLDRFSIRTRDRISVRYATLTFPARDLQYQYRLTDSPDSTWSDPMSAASLTLQRLPLGDHQLEIRARKGGGHYWSAPLQVPVLVRPVWYRTWWAYLLFGLAGMGGVAYLVRYSIGRQRQRIRELEEALSDRDEALREKERELQRQHRVLEEREEELTSQQEEVETTRTTLHVLHDLLSDLTPKVGWSEVLHALAETVEEVDGLDAFEFGYYHDGEMYYEGYDHRRHTYTHRREDFDEKTHLPVWSLVNDEPVRIGDYRQEHTQYVHPAADYRYQSVLCIPFHLPGRQHLVFVAYGLAKHTFDEEDRMMGHLLVKFLSGAVPNQLTPSALAETTPTS